jgi:hypothetical protein
VCEILEGAKSMCLICVSLVLKRIPGTPRISRAVFGMSERMYEWIPSLGGHLGDVRIVLTSNKKC